MIMVFEEFISTELKKEKKTFTDEFKKDEDMNENSNMKGDFIKEQLQEKAKIAELESKILKLEIF